MIATGTGIAPFRGFWQDRLTMQSKLAPMVLVFGCRDRAEAESLYMDELRGAQERGVLTFFHAFSREPGQPKRYVQQVLSAESALLGPLLCSGAALASPVREALHGINASGFDAIVQKGNYL